MLLTILIALQFKDSKSNKTFPGPVTIYVTNNLTGNLQLGVDCKDKHSDFGYQIIQFKESYIFTVKPTPFIPTKLYFCSFSWIIGAKHFDIYDKKRDDDDCDKECRWQKNDYEPCKVNDGSIQYFKWNPSVV
jgi:hypothetical protein